MVQIKENAEAASGLMERIRQNKPARVGLHVSDLLSCSRRTWWFMQAGIQQVEETDKFTLITSLGKGFHNLLETKLEETIDVEGILLTPDEATMEDGEPVLVDFKTTRKSSSKGPEDLDTYIDQLGSYCSLLNIPRGRLHVFYLVGDIHDWNVPFKQRSSKPEHTCYDFLFSNDELYRWREELLRRKLMIEQAGGIEDISLDEHRSLECGIGKDHECPLIALHACEGGGEKERQRGAAFPRLEPFYK